MSRNDLTETDDMNPYSSGDHDRTGYRFGHVVRRESNRGVEADLVTRKRFLRAAIISFLPLIVASMHGCGSKPKPPLRIGINVWPGYEIISLAHSLGYFEEAGLSVDIVEFDSLSDTQRALETGKVDAIGTTTIEFVMINSRAGAKSAKVRRVFDYSNGADMIIAPKEIRSIPELKGKTVGLEVDSVGVFLLGRALELASMDIRDVQPAATHQLAMAVMLEDGKIAAAVTYPPRSVELLRTGKFQVLFDSRQIPREVIDIFVVDGTVARERAEELAAFDQALDRAWVYLQSQREDALRRMANRERLSVREFEKILSDAIELTSPAQQAEFLKKDGPVDTSVRRSAKYLQALGIVPDGDLPSNHVP